MSLHDFLVAYGYDWSMRTALW